MASLAEVFNHLVLPPKLPGKEDTNIQRTNESVLARLMDATNTIGKLTNLEEPTIWCAIRRSLARCGSLHALGRLDKQTLIAEFRLLEYGEPLFLHVVEQNAAIIVRRVVR